jgi:hypothetical protein
MGRLATIFFLSTTLFSQSPQGQQEEGKNDSLKETDSELIAESGQVVNFNHPLSLEPKTPTITNVYLYAAIDGGVFYGVEPSLGTSIRMQKRAHGAEIEFSVLPYNPLDLEAGLGYKTAFSYLYHFRSNRSGIYLGGGPGFLSNHHIFRPLAVTWIGYQFLSQFTQQRRFSCFIDGGITSILEKERQIIVLVPTVRGGVGFAF